MPGEIPAWQKGVGVSVAGDRRPAPEMPAARPAPEVDLTGPLTFGQGEKIIKLLGEVADGLGRLTRMERY